MSLGFENDCMYISKHFFGWDVGYNGTHLEKIIISEWHFGFPFVQKAFNFMLFSI
jgi:hypothetical protein